MDNTDERINELQVQNARLEEKVDRLTTVVSALDKTLRNGLAEKVAVIKSRQDSHTWWVRTITIVGGGQLIALIALALKLFGGN